MKKLSHIITLFLLSAFLPSYPSYSNDGYYRIAKMTLALAAAPVLLNYGILWGDHAEQIKTQQGRLQDIRNIVTRSKVYDCRNIEKTARKTEKADPKTTYDPKTINQFSNFDKLKLLQNVPLKSRVRLTRLLIQHNSNEERETSKKSPEPKQALLSHIDHCHDNLSWGKIVPNFLSATLSFSGICAGLAGLYMLSKNIQI